MSNERQPEYSAILDGLITLGAALSIGTLAWWALSVELPSNYGNSSLAPRPLPTCLMDREGYLQGTLYAGQNEEKIDWQGNDFRCDGMFRPQGAGVRMVFDQHADKDEPGYVLVMGVTEAVLGEPLEEAAANITLIDQTSGKFYTSGEQPRCWTSFQEQQQLSGTSEETWRIDGIIFCQSPLNELRGNGRIQLGDMRFSGLFRPGLDN